MDTEKESFVSISKSLVLRSAINNVSLALAFAFQSIVYYSLGASGLIVIVNLLLSYFPIRDAVALWELYRKEV